MKIFGWMNNKIQSRRNYSLLAHENGGLADCLKDRKDEMPMVMEKETHALLMNNMTQMMENLHQWDDGILSIGTFGLQHLQICEYDDQFFVEDGNEEKTSGEVEDFSRGKDGEICQEIKVAMKNTPLTNDTLSKPMLEQEIAVEKKAATFGDAIEMTQKIMEGEKMKQNGRRVTLADLFNAEGNPNSIPTKADQIPSAEINPSIDHTTLKFKEKEHNKKQKQKESIGKKLKNAKKGELTNHNTPMLQKFMSRMLKKKIYPDFGCGSEFAAVELAGKSSGILNASFPCVVPEGDESASLLPATATIC